MNRTCPHCGASVQPRSRFCPFCGQLLPSSAPVSDPPSELAISGPQRIRLSGEVLSLRDLVNVVESGVHWWQGQLTNADAVTRERAAQSIRDLSEILRSLSEQIAQGRETMRITSRLPTLRGYTIGCPHCGSGNRDGARFCQRCGAPLGVTIPVPAKPPTAISWRLRSASHTDRGQVRHNNQDTVFVGALGMLGNAPATLALVADGMGGAAAGEEASRIAVETIRTQLVAEAQRRQPRNDEQWQQLLRDLMQNANRQVYDSSRLDPSRRGMGTTLTVALIVGDRVHLGSVGDSRAYLFNAAGLTQEGGTSAQLTSDHTLVARLVDIGQITAEEARTHPQRNILYRSIGTDPSVEVDTRSEQLGIGDILLLCSDGLYGYVRDEEMSQFIFSIPDVEQACARLVALANRRGGQDNISVVITRVEAGSAHEAGR